MLSNGESWVRRARMRAARYPGAIPPGMIQDVPGGGPGKAVRLGMQARVIICVCRRSLVSLGSPRFKSPHGHGLQLKSRSPVVRPTAGGPGSYLSHA
jgi:hypothetical protein